MWWHISGSTPPPPPPHAIIDQALSTGGLTTNTRIILPAPELAAGLSMAA